MKHALNARPESRVSRSPPPRATRTRRRFRSDDSPARRQGHKKAIVAVAHSILIADYHIPKDDIPTATSVVTTSPDVPTQSASTRRLVVQLERLEHTGTLQTATAEGPVAA